jgi:hypothetical protein
VTIENDRSLYAVDACAHGHDWQRMRLYVEVVPPLAGAENTILPVQACRRCGLLRIPIEKVQEFAR